MTKMSVRNREIFSLCQSGQGREEVARLFGLTPTRVTAILREERLNRRYSTEETYRSLRQETRPPGKP